MSDNKKTSKNSSNPQQEIPGMNLDTKYSQKQPALLANNNADVIKKEVDKNKKELEKIKDFIVKKYKFTQALAVLPPQGMQFFVKEEEIPKETEKFTQLYMLIPEDNFKEIPKMKETIVKELEKSKQKIWLQIKTPVDLWDLCFDSKFELAEIIGMSYPLFDTGILQSLRLAQIHKSMVLQKFDKYVVSYIFAGSLVRGDVSKESDVDTFIIINDTDVKRMPRLELKERLRQMIWNFIPEAGALAGVQKNLLNVQVWLLTDFWEGVKDAQPVYFTVIRDGVPLYDKGTFMPWKALLKMGKLKPSPEAIDMYMSMGDNTSKRAKRMLMDIVLNDIYWGVTTPSQALMMLNGSPPPSPKHLVAEMKKVFVTQEKLLEQKYIDMLNRVVSFYKDYEHEKVKEVAGKEVDSMLKDLDLYLERLKKLRDQIEKRNNEKTIEHIFNDTFDLLKKIFGNKSQANLIKDFEERLVKTGKMTKRHLRILDKIVKARTEFKKGKLDSHKINDARKDADVLVSDLIDYTQRCDLAIIDKTKMRLKYKKDGKDVYAELMNLDGTSFLLFENSIKKVSTKLVDSSVDELSEFAEKQKGKEFVQVNSKVFDILKKELGDFEVVL